MRLASSTMPKGLVLVFLAIQTAYASSVEILFNTSDSSFNFPGITRGNKTREFNGRLVNLAVFTIDNTTVVANAKLRFTGANGVKLIVKGNYTLTNSINVNGCESTTGKDYNTLGGIAGSISNQDCEATSGPKQLTSIPGNGGGVLIIVVKGVAVIAGNISANGYNNINNTCSCYGGRVGGYIELQANKIVLTHGVFIEANGGTSGRNSDGSYCGNGGNGGIVHLNAMEYDGKFLGVRALSGQGKNETKKQRNGNVLIQTVFKKKLSINTTSCTCRSSNFPNFTLTGDLAPGSVSGSVGQKCELTFRRTVVIKSNTRLNIVGQNSLSICVMKGDFILPEFNVLKIEKMEETSGDSNIKGTKQVGDDCTGGEVLDEIVALQGSIILYARVQDYLIKTTGASCQPNSTIWLTADKVVFEEKTILSTTSGQNGMIRIVGNSFEDVEDKSHFVKKHSMDGCILHANCLKVMKASSLQKTAETTHPITSYTTTPATTTTTTAIHPTKPDSTLSAVEKIQFLMEGDLTVDTYDEFVDTLASAEINETDVKQLLERFHDVATFSHNHSSQDEARGMLEKLATFCDNVLDVEMEDMVVNAHKLMYSLEWVASRMCSEFNCSVLHTESQKIKIHISEHTSLASQQFPPICDAGVCAEIPYEVVQDNSHPVVSAIIVNMTSTEETSSRYRIGSSLFAVSLNQNTSRSFKVPITLHLSINDHINYSLAKLAYWDNRRSPSDWSFDGISTRRIGRAVTADVHHLTNFAVLVQVADFEVSAGHTLALDMVTYIGSAFSLCGYLVTFAVLMSVRAYSSERMLIHMNLVVTLALGQLLFVIGISATSNKSVCTAVAVGLHFFFSAGFGWMLVEGAHLYSKVVNVYTGGRSKMVLYHCIGWGCPAFLVIISAAIHSEGYGTETHCWIDTENNFIWAFVGPVIAVVLINIFVMTKVLKIVTVSVTAPVGMKTSQTKEQIRAGLKAILILMPTLGFMWLFGMLAVNKETIVFQYIFAVLASTQGVLIFFLHCVGNTEVRGAVKRIREKKMLEKCVGRKSSIEVSTGYKDALFKSKKKIADGAKSKMDVVELNSFDNPVVLEQSLR